MLEFLELNGLLGVSHFTFYNHTIGPAASCILQHYIDGKIPTHFVVNSTRATESNVTGDARADNVTFMKTTKITVDMKVC